MTRHCEQLRTKFGRVHDNDPNTLSLFEGILFLNLKTFLRIKSNLINVKLITTNERLKPEINRVLNHTKAKMNLILIIVNDWIGVSSTMSYNRYINCIDSIIYVLIESYKLFKLIYTDKSYVLRIWENE